MKRAAHCSPEMAHARAEFQLQQRDWGWKCCDGSATHGLLLTAGSTGTAAWKCLGGLLKIVVEKKHNRTG